MWEEAVADTCCSSSCLLAIGRTGSLYCTFPSRESKTYSYGTLLGISESVVQRNLSTCAHFADRWRQGGRGAAILGGAGGGAVGGLTGSGRGDFSEAYTLPHPPLARPACCLQPQRPPALHLQAFFCSCQVRARLYLSLEAPLCDPRNN